MLARLNLTGVLDEMKWFIDTAAKLKAVVKGGRWTVKTPGLGKGTWKLSVVATDRAGNQGTARLTLHLTS